MIHELDKVDSREVYDECGCDVERQCSAHADDWSIGFICGCNDDKACVECIDDGIYCRPDDIQRNEAFYNAVARLNGYVDADQMRYYEFTIH